MIVTVEVFPNSARSWVAVVETDAGPFSTESSSPATVETEVVASIREVLGISTPRIRLVDEDGAPWTPHCAPAQLRRLEGGAEGPADHPETA